MNRQIQSERIAISTATVIWEGNNKEMIHSKDYNLITEARNQLLSWIQRINVRITNNKHAR